MLSQNDANNMLQRRNEEGCFLVRESKQNPGTWVLSTYNNGKVWHFSIKRTTKAPRFHIKGTHSRFESLTELVNHYQEHPGTNKNRERVRLTDFCCATRFNAAETIRRAERLGGLAASKRNNAPTGYKEEFEELQQLENAELRNNTDLTTVVAAKRENKHKNRYKNILPFDSTRVILQDDPNSDTNNNDYINANYIKVSNNKIVVAFDAPHLNVYASEFTFKNGSRSIKICDSYSSYKLVRNIRNLQIKELQPSY